MIFFECVSYYIYITEFKFYIQFIRPSGVVWSWHFKMSYTSGWGLSCFDTRLNSLEYFILNMKYFNKFYLQLNAHLRERVGCDGNIYKFQTTYHIYLSIVAPIIKHSYIEISLRITNKQLVSTYVDFLPNAFVVIITHPTL